MDKPNREPDLKVGIYAFYFDEMLQLNLRVDTCYKIKVKDNKWYWLSRNGNWKKYSILTQNDINNYFNEQAEKILLDLTDSI